MDLTFLIQIHWTLETPLGKVCTKKSKHIVAHINLLEGKPDIKMFEKRRLQAEFLLMFVYMYACQCLAF